jgi:histidine triad (HIT) family protein
MDIGRLSAITPGRPAYTAPGQREAGPRPVEPANATAADREPLRRARPAEAVVEGELLRRRAGYQSQSTQEFLHGRQFQAGSAASQRDAARATLSASNRQALGLYLDNHPSRTTPVLHHGPQRGCLRLIFARPGWRPKAAIRDAGPFPSLGGVMTDCLFCRMVKGEIKPDVVYEDDEVLAFRDLNPQAPVHVLVIPKLHLATLNDLDDSHAALMGKLFLAAKMVAEQEGLAERGYRTVVNCNAEAGQSVYHVHLHVLAGRAMHWPPG